VAKIIPLRSSQSIHKAYPHGLGQKLIGAARTQLDTGLAKPEKKRIPGQAAPGRHRLHLTPVLSLSRRV